MMKMYMKLFQSPQWFRISGCLFISLSLSGCDAGGGLVLMFLVIVGFLALNASKKQKKQSTRNTDRRNDLIPEKQVEELISDLADGYEIHVTTTWDTRANAKAGEWVMTDEPINIHGSSISSPMFYMGNIPKRSYPDPSLINPSLKVSKEIKGFVPDLGYWPSYSDMTPGQRRVYLDWLATGRTDLTIDLGYVFVFFYGLERRLLLDQQNADEIIREICRLRSVYEKRSFQRYTSDLLAFNSARNLNTISEDFLPEAFPPSYGDHGYSEDSLNAALGWYVVSNKPLSWSWALEAAANDPRSPSSVVTKRVKDEFEQLFRKRYEEKYGKGIMLKTGKRPSSLSYHPASASLSSMRISGENNDQLFSVGVPNVLAITSQFKPIIEIWTRCIEDLKAFSRQQAKTSDNEPLTPEAWEKLPPELQVQFDHPEANKWSEAIDKYMEEGSVAWIPVSELAVLKGIPVRDRLTVNQSTKIADTAASLEYAIEPDARLLRKGYSWGEKLAVYHDPKPDGHLDASSSFSSASVMLHLAISIAAADGNIDPKELETIKNFLDNQFELSDSERKRLAACGEYLIGSKVTLAGVGKRIQAHLDDEQRHKVGRFLVAVAAADGVFEKSEINALKKAYKAMGMASEDAVEEVELVSAVSAEDGEPVVIQNNISHRKGEPIPPKPANAAQSTGAIKLDAKAIAKIIDDTKDVGRMLGAAIVENEEDTQEDHVEGQRIQIPRQDPSPSFSPTKQESLPNPPQGKKPVQQPNQSAPKTSVKPKISLAALPTEYRPFIKDVIKKSAWTEEEIRALADKHKIMVNGAIDAVNEWAEDELGDFLIDGDNPYTIQRNLLKR